MQLQQALRHASLVQVCTQLTFCYDFTALLTLFPFLNVRSRTLCAQRTYPHPHHVLPVCLLVCFLSHFTCLFTLLLWIVDLSVESLFPNLWLLYLLRLFVLVPTSLVYIWLGMRTRSSSSIYFATTLQVWLARSLVLSSSLIACWPRLLLRGLKKEVNSSFSVSRLPVVKSSLRVYFGMLITPLQPQWHQVVVITALLRFLDGQW